MSDSSVTSKIRRSAGGNRVDHASGSTSNWESGATESHANNPTYTGTPDFSGAAGFTPKAASITAAALTDNLRKGIIHLPLSGARIIAANAIPNLAAAGGILASDSDPILERINGATDKGLRIKWAAASVVEVQLPSFAYPPDLDDTAALTVYLRAKMGGATDTPVIAVGYWEGIGDANAGGNTAALSNTLAQKSVAIAAGDVGAAPTFATVTLIPAAHGTDALELYAAWIEYTRKS